MFKLPEIILSSGKLVLSELQIRRLQEASQNLNDTLNSYQERNDPDGYNKPASFLSALPKIYELYQIVVDILEKEKRATPENIGAVLDQIRPHLHLGITTAPLLASLEEFIKQKTSVEELIEDEREVFQQDFACLLDSEEGSVVAQNKAEAIIRANYGEICTAWEYFSKERVEAIPDPKITAYLEKEKKERSSNGEKNYDPLQILLKKQDNYLLHCQSAKFLFSFEQDDNLDRILTNLSKAITKFKLNDLDSLDKLFSALDTLSLTMIEHCEKFGQAGREEKGHAAYALVLYLQNHKTLKQLDELENFKDLAHFRIAWDSLTSTRSRPINRALLDKLKIPADKKKFIELSEIKEAINERILRYTTSSGHFLKAILQPKKYDALLAKEGALNSTASADLFEQDAQLKKEAQELAIGFLAQDPGLKELLDMTIDRNELRGPLETQLKKQKEELTSLATKRSKRVKTFEDLQKESRQHGDTPAMSARGIIEQSSFKYQVELVKYTPDRTELALLSKIVGFDLITRYVPRIKKGMINLADLPIPVPAHGEGRRGVFTYKTAIEIIDAKIVEAERENSKWWRGVFWPKKRHDHLTVAKEYLSYHMAKLERARSPEKRLGAESKKPGKGRKHQVYLSEKESFTNSFLKLTDSITSFFGTNRAAKKLKEHFEAKKAKFKTLKLECTPALSLPENKATKGPRTEEALKSKMGFDREGRPVAVPGSFFQPSRVDKIFGNSQLPPEFAQSKSGRDGLQQKFETFVDPAGKTEIDSLKEAFTLTEITQITLLNIKEILSKIDQCCAAPTIKHTHEISSEEEEQEFFDPKEKFALNKIGKNVVTAKKAQKELEPFIKPFKLSLKALIHQKEELIRLLNPLLALSKDGSEDAFTYQLKLTLDVTETLRNLSNTNDVKEIKNWSPEFIQYLSNSEIVNELTTIMKLTEDKGSLIEAKLAVLTKELQYLKRWDEKSTAMVDTANATVQALIHQADHHTSAFTARLGTI